MEELAAYASGKTIADRPSSTPLDPQASNAPLDSVSPVGHIAREQYVATGYNDNNSNASEASGSDELDDSGDEDYTPDSQVCSNDDEPLTAESEGSGAEDAEDISIYLMNHDLQHAVSSIIHANECDNRCVEGKAKELESLLCSLSTMNREEKQISIYSLLGTLMQVPVDRARGYGLRDKFNYYLPFVGKVCRPTFAKEKVTTMMREYVDVLSPPPPNVEKRETMYYNLRPYVPHESQNDPLYAKPSEQEGLDEKAAKQARQSHRVAMAMTAKRNQDRRGREVGKSAQAEAPAKRKTTAK